MTTAIYIGRAALAVTLIAAGVAKMGAREQFAQTLGGLHVAPTHRYPLAWALIFIELGLGLASVAGFLVRAIDASIFLLMALMLVVAGLALRRMPGMPCRCFGTLIDSSFQPQMVLRNAVLVLVAGSVLIGDATVSPDYSLAIVPVLATLPAVAAFCLAVFAAVKALVIVEQDRNASMYS